VHQSGWWYPGNTVSRASSRSSASSSPKRERRIGEIFKRDTLMFNGYAEEVAELYDDLDLTVNF
jgi:hypothetical protein